MEVVMVKYKYGKLKSQQVKDIKETMRKQIFFLLLLADPATKGQYPDVDIQRAFDNLMYKINGFNSLLSYPCEIMDVLIILQEAREELNKPELDFETYRKLVLDAGASVQKIKEV